MATAIFIGNAIAKAQVITYTVTAVNVGDTFTATINTKVVTYTVVTGDTTTTAATGLVALLNATNGPEFSLATYTSSANVITATASNPGEPFSGMTNGLTFAATGGCAGTQATVSAGSSPSDPGLAKNWIRSGVNAIPVNGDDVVLQNCTVPLLWNLSALAAVQFLSYSRWQSHTGQIGLPTVNTSQGTPFQEFRPTYFQFKNSATSVPCYVGLGDGGGPPLERYDAQSFRTDLYITGGTQVDFLGTHVSNTFKVSNCSLNAALGAAETAKFASGTANGGSQLSLGNVTFSGALVLNSATCVLGQCNPASITATGSQLTNQSLGLTYTAVTGVQSQFTWNSSSGVTTLTLSNSCTFDKSGNLQPITITNSSIDATCSIVDPNATITFTNPTAVHGPVSIGPFTFTGTRNVKVS